VTVAEKFILIPSSYNDERPSCTILRSTSSLSSPFPFNDVKGWFQPFVDEVVSQTIIWSVLKLNNPQRGFGYSERINHWQGQITRFRRTMR